MAGKCLRCRDDTVSYHPLVSFITEGGRSVEFTSSQEGNASAYLIGSSVSVLYSPGAVFVSVGTAAILTTVRDARKKPWLEQSSVLKLMKSGC